MIIRSGNPYRNTLVRSHQNAPTLSETNPLTAEVVATRAAIQAANNVNAQIAALPPTGGTITLPPETMVGTIHVDKPNVKLIGQPGSQIVGGLDVTQPFFEGQGLRIERRVAEGEGLTPAVKLLHGGTLTDCAIKSDRHCVEVGSSSDSGEANIRSCWFDSPGDMVVAHKNSTANLINNDYACRPGDLNVLFRTEDGLINVSGGEIHGWPQGWAGHYLAGNLGPYGSETGRFKTFIMKGCRIQPPDLGFCPNTLYYPENVLEPLKS